ncbi:hypothetical protein, partial [Pseudomonas quasicaspiana]|uniref:hypothetical protein n=1 Tax=Pseudomonas quasicaspiana TaxID=2829821 RepID=UPI001E2C3393
GVGEGHLFHHRKARRLVFRDFAKSGSLFQSFLNSQKVTMAAYTNVELQAVSISPARVKKVAKAATKMLAIAAVAIIFTSAHIKYTEKFMKTAIGSACSVIFLPGGDSFRLINAGATRTSRLVMTSAITTKA